MLEPGASFPEFELPAHDGSSVSSSALAGSKYLLFFYPKADTPGCTREACSFRDVWGELEEAGVVVLGISFDRPAGNAKFADKHRLPFRLLSDKGRALARAVGAAGLLSPVPKRVSYLVDEQGKVLKAYPNVSPRQHAEEVLTDLAG